MYGFDCVLPMDVGHFSWAGSIGERSRLPPELLELRAQQLQSSSWLREISGLALDKSRRENSSWFDKNWRIRDEPIANGDLVLMRNHLLSKKASKLGVRWQGPHRVRTAVHEGAYQLEQLDGTFFRRSDTGRHLVKFRQGGDRLGVALDPAMSRARGEDVVVSSTTP